MDDEDSGASQALAPSPLRRSRSVMTPTVSLLVSPILLRRHTRSMQHMAVSNLASCCDNISGPSTRLVENGGEGVVEFASSVCSRAEASEPALRERLDGEADSLQHPQGKRPRIDPSPDLSSLSPLQHQHTQQGSQRQYMLQPISPTTAVNSEQTSRFFPPSNAASTGPQQDGNTTSITSTRPSALPQPAVGQTQVSDDFESPRRKRALLPVSCRPQASESQPANDNSDDDDDGSFTCSICLEPWTTSGKHRLVSLKCGHFFGEYCIKRWITKQFYSAGKPGPSSSSSFYRRVKSSDYAKCPECNVMSCRRDIRAHFVRRISAVDRAELDELKKTVDEWRARYARLQLEHGMVTAKYGAMKDEIGRVRSELDELAKRERELKAANMALKEQLECVRPGPVRHSTSMFAEDSAPASASISTARVMNGAGEVPESAVIAGASADVAAPTVMMQQLTASVEEEGTSAPPSCVEIEKVAQVTIVGDQQRLNKTVSARVLAVHPFDSTLLVSLAQRGLDQHTFARVDWHSPNRLTYLPNLHYKMIRDASIRAHPGMPPYLLSVGLDRRAVVTSLSPSCGSDSINKSPVQVATFDVGSQIYSCQWDPLDPNTFYVGCQGSKVMTMDLRMNRHPRHVWDGGKAGFGPGLPAHFSPVHSIVTLRSHSSAAASSRLRIVVANSKYICELPREDGYGSINGDGATVDPGAAILFGEGGGLGWKTPVNVKQAWRSLASVESASSDCYSLSYDQASGSLLGSFRQRSATPLVLHRLFKFEGAAKEHPKANERPLSPIVQTIEHSGSPQLNVVASYRVPTPQTQMARTHVFTACPSASPTTLVCCGNEARSVMNVWDASASTLVPQGPGTALGDLAVPKGQVISDIKGFSWPWMIPSPTHLALLTDSTLMLYNINQRIP